MAWAHRGKVHELDQAVDCSLGRLRALRRALQLRGFGARRLGLRPRGRRLLLGRLLGLQRAGDISPLSRSRKSTTWIALGRIVPSALSCEGLWSLGSVGLRPLRRMLGALYTCRPTPRRPWWRSV